MRVVDVRGVQNHLIMEPTEQAISVPLRGGRSHPQDPETGTILFLSFYKFFVLTSLYRWILYYRRKYWGRTHYLDIWLPAHDNNEATVKVVSNNIKCYV
jgi:hypothetical protein